VRAAMPKKKKDSVAEGNRNNTATDGIRNELGSGRY
jgi:hypothetical protein